MHYIIGASGSGKTTLLRILSGMDTQYEGEAFYRGRNLKKLTDSERAQLYATELGFIAQGFHLIDELTVRENILVPAYLQQSDGEMRLATLLRKLKIENLADQKVRTLSGGQKQRVAIARALAGNPRLILADEPTGALDRETADEIMHILQEISRERPVLVITHDPKICAYADGIISIENGRCSVLQEQEAAPAAYRAEQDAPPDVPVSMGKRALHNFRVQCRRFAGISLAITVAVCAVLLSFSSQNILDEKIRGFEEKNTAFSWGQIPLEEGKPSEQLLTMLDESPQIQQCYAQYPVPGCTVSWNGQDISVPSKQFGSISAESMNIGVMPRAGEIAITPSLAKQFAPDIRTLIGQEVTFTCGDFSKQLKICGIYSGSFDDYYLDAGTEQELYAALPKKDAPVSVAYQVQGFDDVLDVEAQLAEQGIVPVTAAKQVKTLQETLAQLQRCLSLCPYSSWRLRFPSAPCC